MSKLKYSTDDFISSAKSVHGNNYDYTYSNYLGTDAKVSILCLVHGIFEQTPYNHLSGKGCSKCGKEQMVLTKHLNGDCCHPCELSLYEQYRRGVWICTNENWKKYTNIINPHNLIRGKDYHLDHMYSIQRGFLDNIPPNIIGHYTNLQVITSTNNLTKNNKCSKILEQVYRDYDIANES